MSGRGRVVLVVTDGLDHGAREASMVLARLRRDLDVRWASGSLWARTRWHHRVGAHGGVTTRLVLPTEIGGPVVDGDLAAVWFRAQVVAPPGLGRSSPADQDYAAAELQALVVSWLAGLGDRVVNGVTGDGACGPVWTSARWRAEAHTAGLAVSEVQEATSARLLPGWTGSPWDARLPARQGQDPVRSVLVAGERVVGAASDDEAQACRRLASASGCRVLTVALDAAGRVVAASPVAPLTEPDEVAASAAVLAEVAR